jgi:hypothetical protein
VLGALLAIAASGPATAAPAAPDTAVTTRDGAAYQGVLVEQIPGDHLTIQTADGQIHTFAAKQVASVRALGTHAPVRPVAEAGAQPSIVVDLATSDPNARLVQMSVTGNSVAAPNSEICGPPCGVKVPPGTYLIGGGGIVPSQAFGLLDQPAHVRITTEPVTLDHKSTGIILAAGGGIGAASVGLPLWLMGALIQSGENQPANTGLGSPGQSAFGSDLKWTGIVITAVCLVVGVGGLLMYHGDTTARVDSVGP